MAAWILHTYKICKKTSVYDQLWRWPVRCWLLKNKLNYICDYVDVVAVNPIVAWCPLLSWTKLNLKYPLASSNCIRVGAKAKVAMRNTVSFFHNKWCKEHHPFDISSECRRFVEQVLIFVATCPGRSSADFTRSDSKCAEGWTPHFN